MTHPSKNEIDTVIPSEQSESRDLRTELIQNVAQLRRSLDFTSFRSR